jgi:transposase-like protein
MIKILNKKTNIKNNHGYCLSCRSNILLEKPKYIVYSDNNIIKRYSCPICQKNIETNI